MTRAWNITIARRRLVTCDGFRVEDRFRLTTDLDNSDLIDAIRTQLVDRMPAMSSDTITADDFSDEIAIRYRGRHILNLQFEGNA